MTLTNAEILVKVNNACHKFIKNDLHLLKVNASERSMTHKLAEYLQQEFSDFNVDCEYDRDRSNPKKVVSWGRCNHMGPRSSPRAPNTERVFPDVIIHKRDTNKNIIVIEAKKSNRHNQEHDRCKMRAYTQSGGLSYQVGYLITFPSFQSGVRELYVEEY